MNSGGDHKIFRLSSDFCPYFTTPFPFPPLPTQDPFGLLGAPFIHQAPTFPEFKQQFHLPPFAKQHQGLLKGQPFGRHIGEQQRPVGQCQRLFADGRLPTFGFPRASPLVAAAPPLPAHAA